MPYHHQTRGIVNINQFTTQQIRHKLSNEGLVFQCGFLNIRLQTSIPPLQQGLATLYRNHPLLDDDSFIDFSIRLERQSGLRGWLKPQVQFLLDSNMPFKPLPYPQALAMFEWGLNWSIVNHLHDFIFIHSAVVAYHGEALLLPAPSGSGKSTLAAELVLNGYQLYSDEMAIIDRVNGTLSAMPRPIGLKNRSIALIKERHPSASIGPECHDTLKGSVAHLQPPLTSITESHLPATAKWIVIPNYNPESEPAIEQLSRAEGFMLLLQNAFNFNVHGTPEFKVLCALVSEVTIFRIHYQNLDQAVEQIEAITQGSAEDG